MGTFNAKVSIVGWDWSMDEKIGTGAWNSALGFVQNWGNNME
jgi:hypothetical protein